MLFSPGLGGLRKVRPLVRRAFQELYLRKRDGDKLKKAKAKAKAKAIALRHVDGELTAEVAGTGSGDHVAEIATRNA